MVKIEKLLIDQSTTSEKRSYLARYEAVYNVPKQKTDGVYRELSDYSIFYAKNDRAALRRAKNVLKKFNSGYSFTGYNIKLPEGACELRLIELLDLNGCLLDSRSILKNKISSNDLKR